MVPQDISRSVRPPVALSMRESMLPVHIPTVLYRHRLLPDTGAVSGTVLISQALNESTDTVHPSHKSDERGRYRRKAVFPEHISHLQ